METKVNLIRSARVLMTSAASAVKGATGQRPPSVGAANGVAYKNDATAGPTSSVAPHCSVVWVDPKKPAKNE